jgi:thiol-disulfide isomerase/thioredoxin
VSAAYVRVRAPQYPAGEWLNSEPLSHASLRGRFQLLDFWTFCCANCLHVIDELRPLEEKYRDILTVVGIHSPKFEHERSLNALAAAVERYSVEHPVLNDPELILWKQYAIRAWPTLVLVDPEGYVVVQAAGEGQTSALDAMIETLAAEHEARGTLHRGGGTFVTPPHPASSLRFPAKAIALPAERTGGDGSLLVADAGHHQLVELALDGETVLRRIGTGTRGRTDGPTPSFAEPNGLALLPAGLTGYDVAVADTANHLLRGVRLSDGAVVQTIDLGAAVADLHTITGAVPGVLSPWDVAWWPALGRLVVAAAGVHLLLAVDPSSGATTILAGTTVEGLRDGAALETWLAQPSGLAVDGNKIWFVDAETSALRQLSIDGELITVIGEGLFDFGHVDGLAVEARLQHPLGVALLADGTVAVADTYNGAVRRYDPWTATVSTLATDLAEPSGLVLLGEDLVVIESAAHRLVRPVPTASLVTGETMHTHRPVTDVAPGAFTLAVAFEPPPGRKLDERYGPSTQLTVNATPPSLLTSGPYEGSALTAELELSPDAEEGVLHVTAQAASCDDDTVANPACYLARQDWGVPIRLVPDGALALTLMLLG